MTGKWKKIDVLTGPSPLNYEPCCLALAFSFSRLSSSNISISNRLVKPPNSLIHNNKTQPAYVTHTEFSFHLGLFGPSETL